MYGLASANFRSSSLVKSRVVLLSKGLFETTKKEVLSFWTSLLLWSSTKASHTTISLFILTDDFITQNSKRQ